MLSDERIRDVLLTAPDPQEAVSRLIDDANERGGRDNVTVIVVRAQRPTGGGARVSAATGRIVA
jgi:protein phosphatase